MVERITSLDQGYQSGDLSVFPDAIDSKDSLYEVANNAQTTLKQGLSYSGKSIIVEDATDFPAKGMIRLGPKAGESGNSEIVYYDSRSDNVFKVLIRGYAGSKQYQWPASTTHALNAVMAETHNSVKDAILNIERKLGASVSPEDDTIHGRLKRLESKYLAPRSSFLAYPKYGRPSLTVSFHNFSEGNVVRYLWDFGDGVQSIEKNPVHVYTQEGIYTVRLDVITSTGGRGITVKNNYITVDEEESIPFFYVQKDDVDDKKYHFIDQTKGDVAQRVWVYGDGESETIDDPNAHTATHTYVNSGTYEPSLIIILSGQRTKRVFLTEEIIVE